MLFADVDDPGERRNQTANIKPSMLEVPGLLQILGKLLGFAPPEEEKTDANGLDTVTLISDYVRNSPGLGMRLYRTAAGYRAIVTSHEYDPLSRESTQLLKAIGSDPLYMKLCEVQECFRARLTPKFWRCGGTQPPVRFPYADESQAAAMHAWVEDYSEQAAGFGTCELVETLGSPDVHSRIAPLVELHDKLCCQPGLPLA